MLQIRMNSLKSLATNCGPLSEIDAEPLAGEPFVTALDDHLHLGFLYVPADLAVNNEPTVPVEDAAKEEESPTDIHGGNIDVPVLMSSQ
jgi:hypothetical protein